MESDGLGRILLIEFGDRFLEPLASLASLLVYRISISIVMTFVRFLDTFRMTQSVKLVLVKGRFFAVHMSFFLRY